MPFIQIKNLGPISDFRMDIRDFNVLIGAQATGKSTISKSIYYFHVIKELIIEHLYMCCVDKTYASKYRFPAALNKRAKSLFIELFGYSWNLDENLSMEYGFTSNVRLTVCLKCSEKYISIHYSENLIKGIKEIEQSLINRESNFYDFDFSFVSNERVRIREEIIRKINVLFEDSFEAFYIPAGRQLLTLLGAQKTKLDYASIDYVNRRFMQLNESMQSRFDKGILKAHKAYTQIGQEFDAECMARDIINDLKGDYVVKGQHGGIIKNDSSKKRKCDYLVYDEKKSQCHLIELKGAIIKKAYNQLEDTIDHIISDERISYLIDSVNLLNAYIVSPGRQEIPRGVDEKKRRLLKKLATYCRKKPNDINDLVKHVRVLPCQKKLSDIKDHVLCSNDAPLVF